jgi:hypothetical protein
MPVDAVVGVNVSDHCRFASLSRRSLIINIVLCCALLNVVVNECKVVQTHLVCRDLPSPISSLSRFKFENSNDNSCHVDISKSISVVDIGTSTLSFLIPVKIH